MGFQLEREQEKRKQHSWACCGNTPCGRNKSGRRLAKITQVFTVPICKPRPRSLSLSLVCGTLLSCEALGWTSARAPANRPLQRELALELSRRQANGLEPRPGPRLATGIVVVVAVFLTLLLLLLLSLFLLLLLSSLSGGTWPTFGRKQCRLQGIECTVTRRQDCDGAKS